MVEFKNANVSSRRETWSLVKKHNFDKTTCNMILFCLQFGL